MKKRGKDSYDTRKWRKNYVFELAFLAKTVIMPPKANSVIFTFVNRLLRESTITRLLASAW